MTDFSDRLREERESLGLTQEELSSAAGITKNTQHLYEKGERAPGVEYLMALHANVAIDVTYLITGIRSLRPVHVTNVITRPEGMRAADLRRMSVMQIGELLVDIKHAESQDVVNEVACVALKWVDALLNEFDRNTD